MTRRRGILTGIGAAFVVACVYGMWDIGVNPLTFWSERQDIFNLLDRMWVPRIEEPRLVWEAAIGISSWRSPAPRSASSSCRLRSCRPTTSPATDTCAAWPGRSSSSPEPCPS